MSLASKLQKLRGRSAAELVFRLEQKLCVLRERVRPHDNLRAPRLSLVLGSGPAGCWLPPTGPAAAAAADEYMTGHGERGRIRVDRAQDVLLGRYQLLGYRQLRYISPADWHSDVVAGRSAPKVHWSRVPFLNSSIVGDHKVVWELNRHAHFVLLAQAYLLTRDVRFRDEARDQLIGWCQENPPGIGINWASSLEVAFRAISWCWCLRLLGPDTNWLGDAAGDVLGILRYHGVHLTHHHSRYFSPNTHYTGEALGLLYLGSCLEGGSECGLWRAQGIAILRDQLPKQLNADGSYFELATWYHRYTVDFVAHAALLAPEVFEAEAIRERVVSALEFLVHLRRPDGTYPRLGDDDGGQLLRFDPGPSDDWSNTCALAAAVFDHSSLRDHGESASSELAWFGKGLTSKWDALSSEKPGSKGACFPDAGLASLRSDWSRTATAILLDAGPHGGLSGGHGHADSLGCEIIIAGVPIVTDPGTGSYVGEHRDYFRSMRAHSTVMLGGSEGPGPRGPFSWESTLPATLGVVDLEGEIKSAAGSVSWNAFVRNAHHARIALLITIGGRLVVAIADRISAPIGTQIVARWHLSPGVTCNEQDGGFVLVHERLGRVATLARSSKGSLASVSALSSPCYGLVVPSTVLEETISACSECTYMVNVFGGPDAAISIDEETLRSGALALTVDGERHQVQLWTSTADTAA